MMMMMTLIEFRRTIIVMTNHFVALLQMQV